MYNFPEAQQKRGLFRDYVDTWLKGKTDASGWVPNADGTQKTEEEQTQLSVDYARREGISLDIKNMVESKGNKAISILALNSLWRKIGRKSRRDRHPCCSVQDLREKINVMHFLRIMNEEFPNLTFYKIEEDAPGVQTTNIFIATFITCCARLRLY